MIKKLVRLGRGDDGKMHTATLATSAVSFAQPRTGKGAAQIIPTLRQDWTGNTIVVDPKGEAFRYSHEWREAMGQRVVAIDPIPNRSSGKFSCPDGYRVRFNPLDLVGEGGAGYRDLMMLADGLVIPSAKSKDPFFDDTARTLVAGIMAFLLEKAPTERQHIAEVRSVLRDMVDPDEREDLFNQMNDCSDYGELARDAVSYMRREGGKSDSIYNTAAQHLNWLADQDMRETLGVSDFDFEDLRTRPLSLFLVLPFDALETHGPFFRLFTRCALAVMKRGEVSDGESSNRPTLFLLDEFHKLGKVKTLVDDTGAMPGYGVHLWPICHGMGQLEGLYDRDGAEILLGAADVVCVYGTGNDQRTAEYASRRMGILTSDEVLQEIEGTARDYMESEKIRAADEKDVRTPNEFIFGFPETYGEKKKNAKGGNWLFAGRDPVVQDTVLKSRIDAARAKIGKPRISPEEVISVTARNPETKCAKCMFAFSSDGFSVERPKTYALEPYFLHEDDYPLGELAVARKLRSDRRQARIERYGTLGRVVNLFIRS